MAYNFDDHADKTSMAKELSVTPAESEISFLEYRLEVINAWPASRRKAATREAITRRLLSIARSALARPGVDDLVASTCRLLETHFAAPEPRSEGAAHIAAV